MQTSKQKWSDPGDVYYSWIERVDTLTKYGSKICNVLTWYDQGEGQQNKNCKCVCLFQFHFETKTQEREESSYGL